MWRVNTARQQSHQPNKWPFPKPLHIRDYSVLPFISLVETKSSFFYLSLFKSGPVMSFAINTHCQEANVNGLPCSITVSSTSACLVPTIHIWNQCTLTVISCCSQITWLLITALIALHWLNLISQYCSTAASANSQPSSAMRHINQGSDPLH